ncbi:helix-turn-helix domain-containing protein [Escherichia coli]
MREIIFSEIINWIEDNLNKNINAEAIEQISGYSSRHVFNMFRQYIGTSPGRYIRQRRLCKAAYLLRLTNQKIIDISCLLHFDSQQSFCREFKKLFGCSPRHYRQAPYWDFAGLLPPYSPENGSLPNFEFCSLQECILFGYSVSYDEVVLEKGHKTNVLRYDAVIKNLTYCQRDILMCTRYSPVPGVIDKLSINTFVGVTGSPADTTLLTKEYHCEGGDYIKMRFTGTWDEYYRFTVLVYSNVLPTLKIKRRDDVDIEHFHFIKDEERYSTLTCDYYIPIVRNL